MEIKNLQSIFNDIFFRIPDYQRGYSWGKEQLEDLWQDIEILQDGKGHYTGVLSIVQRESVPENCAQEDTVIPANNRVSIVDGQQRITTLIILINAILNSDSVKSEGWINGMKVESQVEKYLFTERGGKEGFTVSVFGYDKDNPSHVYFKKNILGLEDSENVPSRTLYTRNLEMAQEFFASKIKDLSFEEMESVFRKITEHLQFNYYKIEDEFNEFVAFETMNNRGKELSSLELLKNRLIYLSSLLPDNNSNEKNMLRKNINDAWKTIYEYLGKGEDALKDDEFLQDHWVMYFGYGGRKSPKVYKDDLLKNHFTAIAVKSGLKLSAIREYTYDIQDAVKAYFFMHNPEHPDCSYDNKVKHWLGKLNRLGYFSFSPLVTSMLAKGADDSKVVHVLEAAERFNFVAINFRFFQSNFNINHIYKCANGFHKKEWTLDEVKEKLTLEALETPSEMSQESFCEKVFDRYGKNRFYGWKGLKYFLYEYEIYLQKEAGGEEKISWGNAINNETTEHVYPQTPDNGWEDIFVAPEDEDLLHDLGNLLLLSEKLNGKIKNAAFAKKKEVFSKNSYSAIEVSRCPEWNPESVIKRREKLLKFLWGRWRLTEPKK